MYDHDGGRNRHRTLSGVALRNMPPPRASYQHAPVGPGGVAMPWRQWSPSVAIVHDEHYFAEPDAMISWPGRRSDPNDADNVEIVRRYDVTAYLFQRYHQARLARSTRRSSHNCSRSWASSKTSCGRHTAESRRLRGMDARELETTWPRHRRLAPERAIGERPIALLNRSRRRLDAPLEVSPSPCRTEGSGGERR